MKILVRVLSVAAITISIANAKLSDSSSRQTTDYMGSGTALLKGIGTDNLSDYTKFTAITDAAYGCAPRTYKSEPNVMDFVSGLSKATKFYTCEDLRDPMKSRFSSPDCSKAITCRLSVGNVEGSMKQADVILNEIVAKDYAKNSLQIHGDDMERLESLKQFAQKKYDTKLGSQCLARFQRKGKSDCNAFMEEMFVEHQKKCSFSKGCFNNDDNETGVESFSKFKEKHKEFDGKYMNEYYKERISKKFTGQINNDDKNIANLASLVASDNFKALKPEQKIEKFVSAMGLDVTGRLKDPILGYDLGTGSIKRFQTSDKFKELVNLFSAKTVTAESFTKDFDAFRKKRAQALLGTDDICSATPTYIKICTEASQLRKGETLPKDALSVEHLSSRDTKTDDNIEQLKRYLGHGFNEEDYETLVNARRCILYSITDDYGNTAKVVKPKDDSGDSSGTLDSYEARGIVKEDLSQPNMNSIWKSSGGAVDQEHEVTKSDIPEKITEAEKFESLSGMPGTQQAVGPTTNNFSDMYNTSGFDPYAGKEKPKVDEVAENKDNSVEQANQLASSPDKMNDYLMKKLATAEENLEKLKAENEAADADRAKQKKVDEETALIKDLKGQISDLKSQTAKNAEAKKAAAVAETAAAQDKAQSSSNFRNNSSAASISSSRLDAVVPVATADGYDNGRSSAANAPSSVGRSIASSSAVLSSVSNNDGSKTTTLASGIVVTTVDGMTAEKAALTISNRILELNGIPFYIEEGGMVKEIIAVVKDGKVLLDDKGNPIFEKIVKGKVGDKKFAKTKDKDRAPASITDAADLKRDQEEKLKRDRAEYLKLKNLTNDAIKKK